MQTCSDDISNKNQQVSIISETVSIRAKQLEMNNRDFVNKLSFSKEILQ